MSVFTGKHCEVSPPRCYLHTHPRNADFQRSVPLMDIVHFNSLSFSVLQQNPHLVLSLRFPQVLRLTRDEFPAGVDHHCTLSSQACPGPHSLETSRLLIAHWCAVSIISGPLRDTLDGVSVTAVPSAASLSLCVMHAVCLIEMSLNVPV